MGWGLDREVRRRLGLSGVALVVCLAGTALGTVPAEAAAAPLSAVRTADSGSGTSALSGTLVVPGPATAPSGVTVTLTGVPTSGDSITRTTVTRADGTFTFRDLAGGDWIYTITAPYKGTTFSTDTITVPAGQATTVKLPLFASTEDPAKVRTASWTVWLDHTGDRIAVQQDIALTNLGTAAYTGKTPVSGATAGAKAAVALSVAPGADNFQYLGRFEVCCSAVADGTWAHTRPINPGGSSGTLRYEAPVVGSLTFRAQFPTDAFTLLVPNGMTVSSAQLSANGTSTDQGVTYKVYTASSLKAGDAITVALTTPVAASSSTMPWWLVGIALVALVALALGGWALLRRRRAARPAPVAAAAPQPARVTTAAAKPRSPKATKPATPKAAPTPTRPAVERSRAEVLAEELAQLDVKFENGELSDEAAYHRVRESLVQRLVETVAADPTALVRDDGTTSTAR